MAMYEYWIVLKKRERKMSVRHSGEN